jgi:(p)ppGpp synthase/HD superfamily hydrolase
MSHGETSHDESPGRLGPRFQDALVYGAELHRLQLRKGTHIPYVGHLLIVAGTVIEWGGDEDQAIAAMLHDAVEDQGHSGETAAKIRRRFGDRVLSSWRVSATPTRSRSPRGSSAKRPTLPSW